MARSQEFMSAGGATATEQSLRAETRDLGIFARLSTTLECKTSHEPL